MLLAQEVWARFEPLNHNMVLEINRPLPTIEADYYKLSQVFSNLFDNAVKYRGNSSGQKVAISCEEEETKWHFIISNNGPGFDPRYNEKIFELFQRLSDVDDKPGS